MTIVLARTDRIGDLILSLPTIFAIKQMYPNSKLTMLVSKYNADMVYQNIYVDQLVILDREKPKLALKEMKALKPDIFISLYHDRLVGKLARASKASTRVGPLSKLSSFFTYNRGVFQKRSKSIKNESEYNLDLIRSLDPALYDRVVKFRVDLYYPDSSKNTADNFLNHRSINKFIAIQPFDGGSSCGNLTVDEYITLGERLVGGGAEVVYLIGPQHLDQIEKFKYGKGHIYFTNGSILDTVALIDQAHLYIGGSTGTTHIASVLGREVIAIYSDRPTESTARWGTIGRYASTYFILDKDISDPDRYRLRFKSFGKEMLNSLVDLSLRKWYGIGRSY